jgi:hypothetical protein
MKNKLPKKFISILLLLGLLVGGIFALTSCCCDGMIKRASDRSAERRKKEFESRTNILGKWVHLYNEDLINNKRTPSKPEFPNDVRKIWEFTVEHDYIGHNPGGAEEHLKWMVLKKKNFENNTVSFLKFYSEEDGPDASNGTVSYEIYRLTAKELWIRQKNFAEVWVKQGE